MDAVIINYIIEDWYPIIITDKGNVIESAFA
jgi:hypothetical protein